MPTGYTASVEKGITFEKFALDCARAFGACVTMREDPMDTPIPEEFLPSSFYLENLEGARRGLEMVKTMTSEQCTVSAQNDFVKEIQDIDASIKSQNDIRIKYESMMTEVKAWTPPTPDHYRLKEFMIEQLTVSMDHCNSSYYEDRRKQLRQVLGEEWRQSKIDYYIKDIQYREESYREEVERCAMRTKWIKDLRESLKK